MFFSIIIPAYNPGSYFSIAIDSVLSQTFGDWELIVVDDGSRPDEATAIAQVLEAARHRVVDSGGEAGKIRLIVQKNAGVSVARNVGISEARAEWVAFLDNDDIWLPTMLATQRECIEKNPQAVLCHTAFDIIDGEGHRTGAGYGRSVDYSKALAEGSPTLPTCFAVTRQVLQLVGGFDNLYPLAQDTDLFFKVIQSHPVAYSDSVQAHYRMHSENASSKYQASLSELLNIYEKHINWGLAKNRPDVVQAARGGVCSTRPHYGRRAFDVARADVRSRRWVSALGHLCRAFRMEPRLTVRQIARFALRR